MSTQRVVLIVDEHLGRRQRLQALMEASDYRCLLFDSWPQAEAELPRLDDVHAALLELSTMQDTEAASAADVQLMTLGATTVLIHQAMHEWEVELIRDHAGFSAYLQWPLPDAEIATLLEPILPGLSRVDSTATQRAILLVDEREERILRLKQLLEPRGNTCIVVPDWDAAREALPNHPRIVLALLALECMQDTEAASAADVQLMTLGIPAILVHQAMHEWEIELIRDHANFCAYLQWPLPDAELAGLLESLLPGLLGADQSVDLDSDVFDLAALVERESDRVVVPIPSLSSGTLDELPLPRLLYFLTVQGRTGRLIVDAQPDYAEALVRDGGLLASDTLDALAHAFSFTRGQFAFEWESVPVGRPVPLLRFVFESLRQHTPIQAIQARLSPHLHSYPTYTTLFLGRFKILNALPGVASLIRSCNGKRPLSQLLSELNDEGLRALAFAFFTDAIALLDAPGQAPVGITYGLHDRIERVDAPLYNEALGPPRNRRRVKRQVTRHQIQRLNPEHTRMLNRYELLLHTIIERDPYTLFQLQPGCGRTAVKEAYERTRGALREVPQDFPAPLRVTARLVKAGLRDAFMLATLHESDDAQSAPQHDFVRTTSDTSVSALLPEITAAQHTAAHPPPSTPQPTPPPVEGDPEHLYDFGHRCLKARNYEQARKAFLRAAHIDPGQGLYLAYLGWTTFLANPAEHHDARLILEHALQHDASRTFATFVLGTIAMHQKRFDDARLCFEAVLEERPDDFDAFQALRLLKLQQRET